MLHFISKFGARLLFALYLATTWPVAAIAAEEKLVSNKWEAEIKAFEVSDKTNPPPQEAILFIGSSSIRLWKTLERDLPKHKVINRGFGGSQIMDSIHFVDRIVLPYRPKRIVMYAGGNDIHAGQSPEKVFSDYKDFIFRVQATLPETHIAYISIAPNPARWAQVEKVATANKLIETFTKTNQKLSFINVFPHMLGKDGQPRSEIFGPDRLHMNTNGYALWTQIIRPLLDQ